MLRYLSSSGYIVTVCAVVLGTSTCCATRMSIGLAVRFRSKRNPVESGDVWERGFNDEEPVLLPCSRAPSRSLKSSGDSPEFLRLRTFRRLRPGVGSLLDAEADEIGALVMVVVVLLVPDMMEFPPPIEPPDCGFRSIYGCSYWSYEGRRRGNDCGNLLGALGCGTVRERS